MIDSRNIYIYKVKEDTYHKVISSSTIVIVIYISVVILMIICIIVATSTVDIVCFGFGRVIAYIICCRFLVRDSNN